MSKHLACVSAIVALFVAVPAWAQPAGVAGRNPEIRKGFVPWTARAFAPGANGQPSCVAAATAAGRRYALPEGLMLAISEVEAGRPDPHSGRRVPWPWSVNTGTEGRYFATKAQAVAWVRRALATGATSVDVGCMQVNLEAHPHAFRNLEDAFDPMQNADYAARFLVRLHEEGGNWVRATAEYHSRTPAFGVPYQKRVASAAAMLAKPLPETKLQRLRDAWAATLSHGNTTAARGEFAPVSGQTEPPRMDLAKFERLNQSGEL